MPRTRSELADEVEREARTLFAGVKPSTAAVKEAFRDFGRRLGYYVAARGCNADDGEWLYDMAWYAESGGFFTSLPLVLECERAPDQRLDGDFHKLVQARAEVRVWICKLHPKQSLEDHLTIYKQQVQHFAGTQSGDLYLFIIYDFNGIAANIERFQMP